MSLQERIRGDKTNHSSHQSRYEYKQGLLKKVAKAHSYGVSVAIVIVSEGRVSCSEQLVTGLASAQDSMVRSLLAKVSRAMAKTIRSCPKLLAQTASEAAVQQLKKQKRHRKGTSRVPLGHDEGQAAEQPSAAANEASDAELLRGSEDAGTASGAEAAARDAARPPQPGQPQHPVVAACTHPTQPHSCPAKLSMRPLCQCCHMQ